MQVVVVKTSKRGEFADVWDNQVAADEGHHARAIRAAVRVAIECSMTFNTEACRSQQSPGIRNEVI